MFNNLVESGADIHEHLAVMAKHLSVEYWTEDQKATGIWFTDPLWEFWDDIFGKYFWSNRTLIPIIIDGAIVPLYLIEMAVFLAYNFYWCSVFTGNLGKSKWSFCQSP